MALVLPLMALILGQDDNAVVVRLQDTFEGLGE